MPLRPPDYDRLLVPGARLELQGCGAVTVAEPLRAELSLPSGQVVASAWRWEPVAFTETAPPGRYPVLLYPIVFDGNEDNAIAAAVKLVIRDEPVASWTMALLPGQNVAELGDKSFFGFPVDGGEASLIDARYLGELVDSNEFDDFVETAKIDLSFGGLLEPTEDDAGRDAVMFHTGGGDGTYPTWIGHTAGGELACFVIDFMFLTDSDLRRTSPHSSVSSLSGGGEAENMCA